MNRKVLNNLRAHILETFNVDISKKNIESLRELIDYIDDEVTGRYFSDTGTPNSAYWKPDNNWHVKMSGKVLVDRMKEETWEMIRRDFPLQSIGRPTKSPGLEDAGIRCGRGHGIFPDTDMSNP